MENKLFLRSLYIWLIPVLWLLVPACKMNQIVVDIEHPPVFELPDNEIRLVIGNRLAKADTVNTGRVSNLMMRGRSAAEVDKSIVAAKIIRGMIDQLSNQEHYELVGISTRYPVESKSDSLPSILESSQVKEELDARNADLLFSIESIATNISISFSEFANKLDQSKTKIWSNTIVYDVREVSYQNAKFIAKVLLGWRIYSMPEGRMLYEGVLPDSVIYEVQGTSKEEARKKLPSTISALEKTGFQVGIQLAKIISPSYETVMRNYFTGNPGNIGSAVKKVKFRQWDEAQKIWEEAWVSSTSKVKAMAGYNLALVSEMKGELKKARMYIDSAAVLLHREAIIDYQQILHQK